MPLRSRPLFLVPSLMRALPATGAVMVDVSDLAANDVTATSATAAANALLDQLEPLIVEANLAGYEITVVAATTGTATRPCLVLNVEAFLVDTANDTWGNVVTGVDVPFGGTTTAALALRFEPRLALRPAIDGGSTIPSQYAIGFPTPAGWFGAIDPHAGGWLVTTTTSPVTLPDGLTAIAGRPGSPGTPATALHAAIRSAATAQWEAYGRGAGQLAHCGLAPLFDPITWQLPAGDEGVSAFAAVLSEHVWDSASGWSPAYGELAGWTLRELLARASGDAGAVWALDQIRSALGGELVRRHLVDPKAIDGSSRREGKFGPRFDDLFAAVETVGQPLFAVDLFRLLELGLLSLDRRAADEEQLPVLIPREWTDPVLTGFYDAIGTVAPIPIDHLADPDLARARFGSVAALAAVVSVNQAGDHVAGYWHERRYDPDSSRPVRVVEWFGGGNRDHSAHGFVYDMVWVAGTETVTGTYTFRPVGDTLEIDADWGTGTTTFRRRDLPRPVFEPGGEAHEASSPVVRAYWSDDEIAALPDDIQPAVRNLERYSLHPAEMVLLDAIVGRIAADLEGIATATGVTTDERVALGQNLATAFGYFWRDGHESELLANARQYVLAGLMSMPGNNTPIDEWLDDAPPTYFHALARAHAEFACVPDSVTDCLGVERKALEWFATDNQYRYRFHTSMSPSKALKDVSLEHLTEELVKKLAAKGLKIGMKVKGIAYVGPTPQFDIIEAEFQKTAPLPDADWPGSSREPQESEWYDGYIVGGAIAATAGMSVASSTEWNDINALGDRWSPDDFAGWLYTAGLFWGMSVFGLEGGIEAPVNWVRRQLGADDPIRVSGDVSYTKFTAPPKADIWSLSRGFTDSAGLHAELGGNVTGGFLWRRGQPPPDPEDLLPDLGTKAPRRITALSFEVGRSELTAEGHQLLREAAADRLRALASPSTSLEVIGHASFGDASRLYNLTLSQRRAANVERALRAYLGPFYAVPPDRTLVVGLGDQEAEDEQANGSPPEDWRRVDVFINGSLAVQLRTGAP